MHLLEILHYLKHATHILLLLDGAELNYSNITNSKTDITVCRKATLHVILQVKANYPTSFNFPSPY